MAISAIDIQEQGFGTARNGYDMQEVDIFLERVAEEIDAMQAQHKMELQQAMAQAGSGVNPQYEAEIQRLNSVIANLQAQLAAQKNDASVISDAIIAAQRSANQIKEEARLECEKLYREAEAKAREIVGDAQNERQRIVGELERLNLSRQNFMDQYVGLIKHFQDEAIRKFPANAEPKPAPAPAQEAPETLFEAKPQRSYGAAPSMADRAYQQPQPAALDDDFDDEFDIEEID